MRPRPLPLLLLGLVGCDDEAKPSVTSAFEGGAHNCDDLAKAYLSTLDQAKRCTPGTAESCGVAVPDRLGCACTTFVSSGNRGMVDTLRRLERRWTEQMCAHSVGCVPSPCPEAKSAACSAAGRCVDG